MRITVHGDNNDHVDNVTELAAKVGEWVDNEFGGVKVTVQHSLRVREAQALTDAIQRLLALAIPADARVYVDDENRCPSYARFWWAVSDERDHRGYKTNIIELDDDELDDAVAWLPSGSFLIDKSEGPYNPYITAEHLRTLEV